MDMRQLLPCFCWLRCNHFQRLKLLYQFRPRLLVLFGVARVAHGDRAKCLANLFLFSCGKRHVMRPWKNRYWR